MKNYTFIIGSTDDFNTIEDLISHVRLKKFSNKILNYSVYEFDAPKECDLDTVQLIGYGIAFNNDWGKDGTFSLIIEGALDTQSEIDAFNAGVKARQMLKNKQLSTSSNMDKKNA
tara:strand:- start:110 stop:454 length:345 start_codon:yes stop_codon:yes gene_type:complete